MTFLRSLLRKPPESADTNHQWQNAASSILPAHRLISEFKIPQSTLAALQSP